MKWITREKVKVDRVACPWLIKKFVDPEAEFIFVPAEQVASRAAEFRATPFDVEGCELGHHGEDVAFNSILKKYKLSDNPEEKKTQLRAILDRGENRFNISCLPCHGKLGDGNGMIPQRGFRRPPSYHEARLQNAPTSHFYDVMTNGFGQMPSYADQLTPEDRWKVIAYIRARCEFEMHAEIVLGVQHILVRRHEDHPDDFCVGGNDVAPGRESPQT